MYGSETVTIKRAKEIGLIPEAYNYINENCIECGYPILTTTNLKKQFCSNDRCILKLSGRLVKMLNNFGIIGIGKSFAEKFLKYNNIKTHIYIFVATEDEFRNTGYNVKAAAAYEKIQEIKKSKYTFAELLSKMALPGLDETAIIAFRQFYNFNVFKEYIKELNLTAFQYLLKVNGIGRKKAQHISELLVNYEKEISAMCSIFKLRMPGKDHLRIVMTGDIVYYRMSKAAYLNYLNRIFEGYVSFEWTPEAVVSADYVVTSNKYITTPTKNDEGEEVPPEDNYDYMNVELCYEMSRKHRKAIEIAKRTKHDYIVTPEELVLLIKNKIEKGEIK